MKSQNVLHTIPLKFAHGKAEHDKLMREQATAAGMEWDGGKWLDPGPTPHGGTRMNPEKPASRGTRMNP